MFASTLQHHTPATSLLNVCRAARGRGAAPAPRPAPQARSEAPRPGGRRAATAPAQRGPTWRVPSAHCWWTSRVTWLTFLSVYGLNPHTPVTDSTHTCTHTDTRAQTDARTGPTAPQGCALRALGQTAPGEPAPNAGPQASAAGTPGSWQGHVHPPRPCSPRKGPGSGGPAGTDPGPCKLTLLHSTPQGAPVSPLFGGRCGPGWTGASGLPHSRCHHATGGLCLGAPTRAQSPCLRRLLGGRSRLGARPALRGPEQRPPTRPPARLPSRACASSTARRLAGPDFGNPTAQAECGRWPGDSPGPPEAPEA